MLRQLQFGAYRPDETVYRKLSEEFVLELSVPFSRYYGRQPTIVEVLQYSRKIRPETDEIRKAGVAAGIHPALAEEIVMNPVGPDFSAILEAAGYRMLHTKDESCTEGNTRQRAATYYAWPSGDPPCQAMIDAGYTTGNGLADVTVLISLNGRLAGDGKMLDFLLWRYSQEYRLTLLQHSVFSGDPERKMYMPGSVESDILSSLYDNLMMQGMNGDMESRGIKREDFVERLKALKAKYFCLPDSS